MFFSSAHSSVNNILKINYGPIYEGRKMDTKNEKNSLKFLEQNTENAHFNLILSTLKNFRNMFCLRPRK